MKYLKSRKESYSKEQIIEDLEYLLLELGDNGINVSVKSSNFTSEILVIILYETQSTYLTNKSEGDKYIEIINNYIKEADEYLISNSWNKLRSGIPKTKAVYNHTYYGGYTKIINEIVYSTYKKYNKYSSY